MSKRHPWLAAATTAIVSTITAGCTHIDAPEMSSVQGEERLAEMLRGKTAGEPQSCIFATISNRLKVIDETAVVYDAGNTIYVARPQEPRSLDSDDVLVIERTGGQLCKQDIIRTVDRTLGFTTGAVFLGDFVPYR